MSEPLLKTRTPRELAEECPVNIHLSGCDGGNEGETHFPWSYRMNRVGEVTSTYVSASDVFILDSAINDDDVTNDDVIESLETYDDVDYVLPADVPWNPEKTTERVFEFLDMLDDAGIDVGVIVPLQPTHEGGTDHADHYRELEGLSDYYAVGGLKDAPVAPKYEAVRRLRSATGDDVDIHGLGYGVSYFQSSAVIDEPVVDSVDCSTPIMNGKKGYWHEFDGSELVTREMDTEGGDYIQLESSMRAGLTLIAIARKILHGVPEGTTTEVVSQTGLLEGGW